MTTKHAESVIGTCLTNLQKSYIELLEQNDVEGYAEVVERSDITSRI